MSDLALDKGLRSFDDVTPADWSDRVPVHVRREKRRRFGESLVGTTAGNVTSVIMSARLRVAPVIQRPSRLFRLRGPFVVQLERLDHGTVFASHRDLPVHGYGSGDAEALAAFEEAFEVQWDHLVQRSPDELTASARVMREQMEAVVDEIVPH